MPVSLEQFRQGMAMFATGVTVISTLEADGNVHGMTANAFTSVCLDPPLILVSIGHQRNTYANVQARGRFGVNILSLEQEPIARYFALEENGVQMEAQYDGVLPDLFFSEHSEIVLSGQLGPSGVFQSDRILIKCPSKYQSYDEVPERYFQQPQT